MKQKEFVNKFIWDKFKKSFLTISSILFPFGFSILFIEKDFPMIFHVFSLLSFIGLIGTSYWYHWNFKVEDLAKEASDIFIKSKDEENEKELDELFLSIPLKGISEKYDLMKWYLREEYLDFLKILNEQKIITEIEKNKFKESAKNTYKEGLYVLSELHDLLIVKNSLKHKKTKEIKVFIKENEDKIKTLEKVLKKIIDSFSIATSKVAIITSNTKKEDLFNESDLEKSIEEAKIIKEKIESLSSSKEDKLNEIYKKYIKE